MKWTFIISFLLVLGGLKAQNEFQIQAHRGSRALYPENTLYAFDQSVNAGFRIIELDVVMSVDFQLVVSHDPWMNASICQVEKEQKSPKVSLYSLTYEQIKDFDCGILGNPKFPVQEKKKAHKPLLKDVLLWANQREQEIGEKLILNIEIKSKKSWEGVYIPSFSIMCDSLIMQLHHFNRVDIVQSFDARVLQYLHQKAPHLPLSYLVANAQLVKSQIRKLGFSPTYYSPNYRLVNAKNVKQAHQLGMKVVPWTVNDDKIFAKLLDCQIDGVISDHPHLLKEYYFQKSK